MRRESSGRLIHLLYCLYQLFWLGGCNAKRNKGLSGVVEGSIPTAPTKTSLILLPSHTCTSQNKLINPVLRPVAPKSSLVIRRWLRKEFPDRSPSRRSAMTPPGLATHWRSARRAGSTRTTPKSAVLNTLPLLSALDTNSGSWQLR